MNFYFYIFGAIILYAAGDFLGKIWSIKGSNVWLILAMVIYMLGALFFAFAIKKSSLSLAVAIAPLAIAIISLMFGYFYFAERLTNFQYLGIALGLAALTLLLFPFQIFSK
ncbi:MAG: hypothetical protein K9L85_03220 [Candidatus Peribacteraceae bacterium]|nr:hypothetical protein [Candidatus Peribacteraceae bacterium]